MTIQLKQVAAGQTAKSVQGTTCVSFETPEGTSPEENALLESTLCDVIDTAKKVDELSLSGLRHIVLSSSFVDDTRRFLEELGRPETVTSTDSAQAVGKTISWNADNSHHSLLVLPLELVKEYATSTLFKGVCHHELAHVHDDDFRFRLFGLREHPDARDLDAIIQFLAEVCWSEFFSEQVASRYYSDSDKSLLAEDHEIITHSIESASEDIADYRDHGDILLLWQNIIVLANVIAGVLGRNLGRFAFQSESTQYYMEFKNALNNHGWMTQVVSNCEAHLKELSDPEVSWHANSLQPLGESILEIFHGLGVFPRLTSGDLYIDVP